MATIRRLADPSLLFRAFADPTRLRILNLLIERELCVCDLCAVIDEVQPKVSRHLAYLRRTGLITVREEGRWAFYRITSKPSPIQETLLACVGSCLRDFEQLRRDLRRLDALPKRGRQCA
jgi:ArsR family transcriptional regulator